MISPRELKILYENGENILQHLRNEKGTEGNTQEMIDIVYDLQTGSYVAAMDNAAELMQRYTKEVANTILSLCPPTSILEAGVGEATNLSGVLEHLGAGIDTYGFDLSWSRIAYGKRWLQGRGLAHATLCTGNLLHIPFSDNSIDVVYTSHSIEPNGGYEEQILCELYRVARRFLVLLEPGYELASEEARQRMDCFGYCRNLKGTAERLGYEVLAHELFPLHPYAVSPLNPTALTIIRKETDAPPAAVLACPKFKTPLQEIGGMMFSPEGLVVYPIVGGIPCLRIENGIFASKFQEVIETTSRSDRKENI